MLHEEDSNQATGSPETGLAVYGDGSDALFGDFQKIVQNVVWWCCAVGKYQVKMIDAVECEPFAIV